MPEFLIAARDLDSGYRRGDPIVVKPDGHLWGRAEGPPDFIVVAVSGVSLDRCELMVRELTESILPGDPDYPSDTLLERATPEDIIELPETLRRRVHRRDCRVIFEDLSVNKLREVERTGRTSGTVSDVGTAFRRLADVDTVTEEREFSSARDSDGRPISGSR